MEKEGNVIGAALLIAGSCIGAGMLALPILTGFAGFIPTLFMLVLAGAFMTSTALLLVETSGWFTHRVHLISMVSHTLGRKGRLLCWILYLFLFYSLLVAYMAGSGIHTASLVQQMEKVQLPNWAGTLFFVAIFGGVVYLGTKYVDLLNRWLMVGKIGAYIGLVGLGFVYVKPAFLLYFDLKYVLFSLPILVISFGFHNMIPTLVHYLGGDTRRAKQAIIGGAAFAFVVYLLWEIIGLGILPLQGRYGIEQSFRKSVDAAGAIRHFLGLGAVGIFAQLLAFFAILTSFLAQSLSLVHFLRDGLKMPYKFGRESIWLCGFALLPPLVVSVLYPQIFYKALNFAGGICAVVLFGIFPVLMVWKGRYHKKESGSYRFQGGKGALVLIFFFALLIFIYQAFQMLHIELAPKP